MCEALNLLTPFDGACFGHAMNKAAQYVTNDDKVPKDLGHVNVKVTQTSLQVCITWPKKFDMLIILNLGIAMDFDVDLSIFVVDCK